MRLARPAHRDPGVELWAAWPACPAGYAQLV
jgi:hypothetical protein